MARGEHRLTTAAEILGKAAGRLKIDEGMRLYRLWDLWPGIVGASLADHARPMRWQGRNLVIRVEHPAWMQELGFLKQQIREKIDGAFPEAKIRAIRFEVGELPSPPKGATKAAARKLRELDEDELEYIEQALGEIDDPDTKEAARRAMIRGFQGR